MRKARIKPRPLLPSVPAGAVAALALLAVGAGFPRYELLSNAARSAWMGRAG